MGTNMDNSQYGESLTDFISGGGILVRLWKVCNKVDKSRKVLETVIGCSFCNIDNNINIKRITVLYLSTFLKIKIRPTNS